MRIYLVKRLGVLLGGWLIASVIIFVTLRLLPGDTAQIIGGTQASAAEIAQIRQNLGLDRPLIAQYFSWIGGLLTGNLGNSLVTGQPIAQELAGRAWVTLPLAFLSLVFALLFALPLGVLTAYRRRNPVSRAVTSGSMLAAAVPLVWAGMLLILVFSNWLGWFSAVGFPHAGWADPLAAFQALFLPALTVGLVEGAVLFRFVRNATAQALGAEHVRTAMAFGYTRLEALLRWGLPGVGLSIVSILGLQLAGLIAGTVVIEGLFALPGIGRMLVEDVGNRDLLAVQSTLLVLTGFILLLGVLIDVVHRLIDPRLSSKGVDQ